MDRRETPCAVCEYRAGPVVILEPCYGLAHPGLSKGMLTRGQPQSSKGCLPRINKAEEISIQSHKAEAFKYRQMQMDNICNESPADVSGCERTTCHSKKLTRSFMRSVAAAKALASSANLQADVALAVWVHGSVSPWNDSVLLPATCCAEHSRACKILHVV